MTRGPGLIGALLVGLSSAKALAAARGLPLIPVDHLHGHVVASTLGPDPIEPPYLCLVASGGHTFLARVDEPGGYADPRPDARRRRRRGVRQGRPDARPRLSRRTRRSTGWPREGDPQAFDFPRSLPEGARARADSTSASPVSRPRCSTASAISASRRPSAAGPTSPPPTRRRSSDSLTARLGQAIRARGRRAALRSAAASRPTRSCAPRPRGSATSSACGSGRPRARSAPTTRR